MLIPDHLWAQMSEDEQRLVKETMNGLRRSGRQLVCPHCAKTIQVLTSITARVWNEDDPFDPQTAPTTAVGSAADRQFLAEAQTSGLLDAFASAVRTEKEHTGVPNNLGAYFLLFCQTLTPTRVSAITLATWIQEFGGRIETLQSQGVIAVLSDGELVAFVPNRLTQAATIGGKGPRPKLSTAASFEHWTKSKFGYVPVGARHFGDALKQRNVGKFGGIVQ